MQGRKVLREEASEGRERKKERHGEREREKGSLWQTQSDGKNSN